MRMSCCKETVVLPYIAGHVMMERNKFWLVNAGSGQYNEIIKEYEIHGKKIKAGCSFERVLEK